MNKLNIGCGSNWSEVYPDYKGLDIIDYGQDFVGDIFEKFNDKYNGVNQTEWDEVMANHFLEHFNQDDVKIIMAGVNRILKKGGLFKIVVPHMKKDKSWVLTHKTFWNEETIKWLEQEDAFSVYGLGRWKILELVTNEKGNIHALLQKI